MKREVVGGIDASAPTCSSAKTFAATSPARTSEDRSIDDLRLQSTQKLKRAWESIYDRFEDAHLQVQDEIYLGRRHVKGDFMRVIRDRGHLRSLSRTTLGFGCFHIDKAELIGCEAVKQEEIAVGEVGVIAERKKRTSPEEGSLGAALTPDAGSKKRPLWSQQDPDLVAFLQAEARRKEICGSSDSEEEDNSLDDVFGSGSGSGSGVFDFGKPEWVEAKLKSTKQSSATEDQRRNTLEIYSLALAGWNGTDKKHPVARKGNSRKGSTASRPSSSPLLESEQITSLSVEVQRTPLPKLSTLLPTPPMSHSSSAQGTPASQRTISTPDTSSMKRCKSPAEGSVNKRRKRRAATLTRQWRPSTHSPKMMENACQGEGICAKSLCLMCGGF